MAFALTVTGALSCGDDGEGGAEGTGPAIGVKGEVTVFAAASLTQAFNELAEGFEAAYPGADVSFNLAGTPTLRTQLEQGARADVFASANEEQMRLARENGVIEGVVRTFARNRLVVITPGDNPGDLHAPEDLAGDGLKLVLANENVPAGAYTRQMLEAMEASGEYGPDFSERVMGNVVSLESNVKQVVAKVELGEADAGIVYGTDVTPDVAPRLRVLEVPDQYNVIAEYPIALARDGSNHGAGQAFIDYLLSGEGQGVLQAHGFLPAEEQ